MHVDLASVRAKPDDFQISERDGRFLITPTKTKHKWEPDERWLRSVVCDATGNVLSIGFPKFLNYHEDVEAHDAAIAEALWIEAPTKEDGSLIILSMNGPEYIIRTRGSFELGDFDLPVRTLIDQKYPDLLQRAQLYQGFSLLFEYTAPDNRIVVDYPEASLTLLGVVKHDEDAPILLTEMRSVGKYAHYLGVPCPRLNDLPDSRALLPQFFANVRQWESKEGVVVSCNFPDRNPVLIKVKADWYVMIHALRFQLSEKKLRKLLVLLYRVHNIYNFAGLQAYLYNRGYDFEVTTFLESQAQQFFTDVELGKRALTRMTDFLDVAKTLPAVTRKDIVQHIQTILKPPKWVFSYAMAYLDGKEQNVLDSLLLGNAAQESAITVRMWLNNAEGELATAIKTPLEFEEEEEDV